MQKLFLWALLLFPLSLFAQRRIVKELISSKTLDSLRNHSHITIEKLSEDSAFLVKQFDAHDSLMVIGTYKDEKVTVPSGRFKYYRFYTPRLEISYNYTHHKADTVFVPGKNRLTMTGHYVNGQKEGVWTAYDAVGRISSETYEKGILNGIDEFYDSSTGKVYLTGNYINDLREGNWHMLSFNGDTMETQVYKKGKIIKTISFLNEKKFKEHRVIDARPTYDFIRYLNNQLSKKGISRSGTARTRYFFSIDTVGYIITPSLLSADGSNAQNNLEVDTVVINAMLAAPLWVPAYKDKKPVLMAESILLDVVFDKKGIRVSQAGENIEDVERFIRQNTDPARRNN